MIDATPEVADRKIPKKGNTKARKFEDTKEFGKSLFRVFPLLCCRGVESPDLTSFSVRSASLWCKVRSGSVHLVLQQPAVDGPVAQGVAAGRLEVQGGGQLAVAR